MSAPLRAAACPRCRGELEQGDLRCPVCALAVPRDRTGAEAITARIVRCSSCGASLSWVAEAQAPRCAFCDSVMEIELEKDPPEQAEFYLPFTVSPERARQALDAFLRQRSFFRPQDLAAAATLDHLRAMWWPAWLFTVRAQISWTADSDAGARRAQWAPHSGTARAAFENVTISASRGLGRDECGALLAGYQLQSRRTEPRGPDGAQVERFDVNRSGARRLILEGIEREAERHIRPQIPGSRARKVNTAVLLEGLDTDRYGLPAYVLAYRYRGKLFRVVINGQDAEKLVGKAPVSPWKVLLAVLGGALAVAGVLALIALLAGP